MAKKIPTALLRDPSNRAKVLPEITPGCEWVFAGEGRPTRKFDGTCVMFDGTSWWARREIKPGKGAPEGYVEVDHDPVTGKTQGWEPMENSGYAKFLHEALDHHPDVTYTPGTYELMGPKIQGNPEGFEKHEVRLHEYAPTIEALVGAHDPIEVSEILISTHQGTGYEGVVWHHPDGRMAKLKARDF